MKGMMTIEFGALCDPIEVQLRSQGLSLSFKESQRFQAISDAIIMLHLNRIIPDSVRNTAQQKLMKLVSNAESLAECEP